MEETIKLIEELIDIYSYHLFYQSEKFINYCNEIWTDE